MTRSAQLDAVVTDGAPVSGHPSDDSSAELSTVLWKERQLLDLLAFKMEEEQLLLAAGKSRWLPNATREVEMVVEKLRGVELLRAVRADAVAARVGLAPDPTLQALAGAAPAPWDDILSSHRQAFLEATQEIARLAEVTRDLLSRQQLGVRRSIDWLTGHRPEPAAYDATGVARRNRSGHLLLNETL